MYLYDEKGMGTGYLSGAEYLRYGIGQSDLSFHGPVEGQGVQVFGYEKDGLNVRMSIRNESSGESYVEVPLQHYKGYTAVVSATGEGLELEDGFHFDIRIRVPKTVEIGRAVQQECRDRGVCASVVLAFGKRNLPACAGSGFRGNFLRKGIH